MANKPDVWMPLFIADYRNATVDLTTEEHGAYLLLLMAMWSNGGRLPNDAERLRRIALCSKWRWKFVWDRVSRFFDPLTDHDGEFITQKRLVEEWEKAKSINESRKKGGKITAEKRWNQATAQHSSATNELIAQAVAPPLLEGRPSPPQSQITDPDQRSSPYKSPPLTLVSEEPVLFPDKPRASPARAKTYEPAFDKFWNVTNKRGSKDKAHKTWLKLGRPDVDKLIDMWNRWKLTKEWRDGFAPHVLTWLNGRMHEQDPPDDVEEEKDIRFGYAGVSSHFVGGERKL